MSNNKTLLVFISLGLVIVAVAFLYFRDTSKPVFEKNTPEILTDEEKRDVLDSLSAVASSTSQDISSTEKTKILESLSQPATTSPSAQDSLSDEEKKAILKSLEGR